MLASRPAMLWTWCQHMMWWWTAATTLPLATWPVTPAWWLASLWCRGLPLALMGSCRCTAMGSKVGPPVWQDPGCHAEGWHVLQPAADRRLRWQGACLHDEPPSLPVSESGMRVWRLLSAGLSRQGSLSALCTAPHLM